MAIQVNGTTVIDNSRALTNISSADAATVAALGAAGVGGGAWEELADTTGSGSYIQYTFPSGYRAFQFYFGKMVVNGPSYYHRLMARFTDGSNNLITSAEYSWWGPSNDNQNSDIEMGYSHVDGSKQRSTTMLVINPKETGHTTGFFATHGGKYDQYYEHFVRFGTMENIEANNAIRFYDDSGGSITSLRYSVYGIKG